MKAYRIVDFEENYEVNSGGRAAIKGQRLKVNKLEFYRSRVFGHNLSPEFQAIMQKGFTAGVGQGLAAFGLWHKLLELASNQKREFRGWILDKKQRPLTAAQIGNLIGEQDPKLVENLLAILMDPVVDFVEYAEFSGTPPVSAENSEGCGGLFLNSNSTEQTEPKAAGKKGRLLRYFERRKIASRP